MLFSQIIVKCECKIHRLSSDFSFTVCVWKSPPSSIRITTRAITYRLTYTLSIWFPSRTRGLLEKVTAFTLGCGSVSGERDKTYENRRKHLMALRMLVRKHYENSILDWFVCVCVWCADVWASVFGCVRALCCLGASFDSMII